MEIHPEYRQLADLKNHYLDLLAGLLEKEYHLLHHRYYQVLTDYMEKVGTREYEVFQLQLDCLKLKRKAELIRAYTNRQETVDMVEVERKLETEYASFRQQLGKMARNIETANVFAMTSRDLSDEDSQDLRKLYKQLVKKLHPDAAENVDEHTEFLWNQVMEAYETGNLEKMRMLESLAGDIQIDRSPSSLERMRERVDIVREKVLQINKKIDEILSLFPFDEEEFLQDEAAVAERQMELEKAKDFLVAQYKQAKQTLDELLRSL